MQLKKILYVVLVAIMMFSVAAFGIAAEGEATGTETTEKATADISVLVSGENNVVKPNEKFTVDVKVDNNPGIAAIQFTVAYNTADYTYKGETLGKVFNEKTANVMITPDPANGKITIIIINNEFAESAIDGSIISFEFQSKRDADLAEIYIDENNSVFTCFQSSFESVECNITNSGIIKSHDYKIETTDATCTSNAKVSYKCNACDSAFEEVIADSMLDHTPTPGEGKDATCTETGITPGSFCSVCHAELEAQEEIPVIDHTPVDGEAKAPTCTEKGNTAGKYCSACDFVIEAQEEIAATGHSFPEQWTVVTEATYKAEGEEQRTCANGCGEVEKRAIAKLDPPAVNMTSAPTEPWVKGTETGLQFVSSADRSEFVSVSVNGAVIDSSNYVLNTDSTTVVLKASYLETLEDGTYSMTITSEYGSATANFEVISESNVGVIVAVIVIAVVVIGVVATVVVLKKKELI